MVRLAPAWSLATVLIGWAVPDNLPEHISERSEVFLYKVVVYSNDRGRQMFGVAETFELALAGLETSVVSFLKAEAERFPKAIREALDAAAREREGAER